MSKNDNNKETETTSYLKQLEEESSERKKEEALKILHRSQTKANFMQRFFQPWQQKFNKNYESRKREFIKQVKYN